MSELRSVPSIPALARWAAGRFGSAEAVVDGSRRVSFEQLAASMTSAARALVARGVEPGDRVALWAPNSADWIVAALGVLAAGGVLVPVNTRFKGDEAGFVLRRSGARLLLVADEVGGARLPELLAADGGSLPDLQESFVLSASEGLSPLLDGQPVDDPALAAEVERRTGALREDDVCDLIFTSGTTGRPKGVMLTHGQSLRVYQSWTEIVGLRRGDRYLVVYPFFHTAGYKSGWLSCLIRGATVVPEPTFDVEQVFRRVEQEGITMLPGPPTVLQDILDSPARQRFDLSSLRLTVTGASVVPVELVRRLRAEMSFDQVVTGYGLTETCGTVAMCRHDDDPETVARWSGRAIPDTELGVMDDAGALLPPGEPGEVVTRGYHVMKGYFDDPDATAGTIDGAGWLHTGDIGVMNERGYVRITDRKKDMFIVGGFNAYPAEIEGFLLRHPAVSQAAVVGVPDPRLGEVGFAFLVARPGEDLDPEQLLRWSRESMANFKAPRHARVVDRLPVNATGKVAKYELRDRARQEVSREGNSLRAL